MAVAIVLVSGCAPYPVAAPPGGIASPPAARPTGTEAPPSGASGQAAGSTATRTASVDSTPSPEALQVLASIPEPLRPEERVPPPEKASLAAGDSAARATADTSRAAPGPSVSAAPDSGGGEVPVPEPTYPLGQRPPAPADSATSSARADTAAATPPPSGASQAPGPPSAAPGPAKAPGAQPTAAVADTCWRVQLGAPLEPDRAEKIRGAAQDLLLVPMVVERERGRYKVRTRDCMSGGNAERLRERAQGSGFSGAFRYAGAKP